MCSLEMDISFQEFMKYNINWEEVSKRDTYECYGVNVESIQRNWQYGQVIHRNVLKRLCIPRKKVW